MGIGAEVDCHLNNVTTHGCAVGIYFNVLGQDGAELIRRGHALDWVAIPRGAIAAPGPTFPPDCIVR